MKLQMTEEEICREYREAKDRRLQIGILADLNLVEECVIREVLYRHGELKKPGTKPGSHHKVKRTDKLKAPAAPAQAVQERAAPAQATAEKDIGKAAPSEEAAAGMTTEQLKAAIGRWLEDNRDRYETARAVMEIAEESRPFLRRYETLMGVAEWAG